jgi:hypothetical protein
VVKEKMKKTKIIIIVLVLALVASNAWWAFHLIDAGVTQTYMGVSLEDNKEALSQALAILPAVAQKGATREKIISAALMKGDKTDVFEKDGFVWVRKIGLKFNQDGQLVEVSRAWSPP